MKTPNNNNNNGQYFAVSQLNQMNHKCEFNTDITILIVLMYVCCN